MRTRNLELETIRLEQQGRVVIARIDHPPFNYMTGRMQRDLDALSTAVDEDASVGAVIVTAHPRTATSPTSTSATSWPPPSAPAVR